MSRSTLKGTASVRVIGFDYGNKVRTTGRWGVLAFRRNCEAEFLRQFHQAGERVGLHFLHHLTRMCLHGDLTDTEFSAYLFVWQPGYHQGHNLPFATGKRCVTVPELL